MHLLVRRHLLTILGAGPADLGAGCAGPDVQRRAAQHEVRAGLANFYAVEHEPNVPGLGVVSALLEAVIHRFETYRMAFHTLFDAIAKLIG